MATQLPCSPTRTNPMACCLVQTLPDNSQPRALSIQDPSPNSLGPTVYSATTHMLASSQRRRCYKCLHQAEQVR